MSLCFLKAPPGSTARSEHLSVTASLWRSEVGALRSCRLEEPRIDRSPVRGEGAVVCRRLEPVDVGVARARAALGPGADR